MDFFGCNDMTCRLQCWFQADLHGQSQFCHGVFLLFFCTVVIAFGIVSVVFCTVFYSEVFILSPSIWPGVKCWPSAVDNGWGTAAFRGGNCCVWIWWFEQACDSYSACKTVSSAWETNYRLKFKRWHLLCFDCKRMWLLCPQDSMNLKINLYLNRLLFYCIIHCMSSAVKFPQCCFHIRPT